MSGETTQMESELIDFAKYALHESMLPHHFMPNDVNWRQTRVAVNAQKILSRCNVVHEPPQNYTLLHNESYYEEKRQKPYSKLQRFLLRWFF